MLSRRPVQGASGAAMPPTAVVSVAGRRGHNEDVGGVRSAEVAGRPVSLLLVAGAFRFMTRPPSNAG